MLDIHRIMKRLAENRPVFHDEKDFQKSLEALIRDFYPGCETILEVPLLPHKDPRRQKHHDILVKMGAESAVIELKYPTEKDSLEHEGELFEFGESGLDEHGYYNCVKDISRIEQIIAKRSDIQSGIFVLLTHRPPFWRETIPSAKSAVYSLHEGRILEGMLAYRDNKRPPINLHGVYRLRWQPYSNLRSGKYPQFRYLAVEVGK